MKHLILITTISLQLIGCGKETTAGDGPFTARILTSNNNGYSIENVTFKTLLDPDHLDGEFSSILGDAALNADAEIEEFIRPDAKDELYIDKGKEIRLDYSMIGGVIHPKNFDSMAMLAMSYNYEKTVLFWQDNLNLDLSDFGKLRLFYAPRIKRKLSGGSFEGTVKVNAAFLPGPRDFFFFKTSPIELVPINMNYGVMAHEFSHAIFDLQFAGKDAGIYNTDNSISELRLRAINEGIADFFSFMVTNRVEEFGESLSELKEYRTLPVPWTIANVGQTGCPSEAYCEGSLLASALYEIALTEGENTVEVGKIVFEALPSLKGIWIAQAESGLFDYDSIINLIINSADNKSLYCEKFQKYFNTQDLIVKMTSC